MDRKGMLQTVGLVALGAVTAVLVVMAMVHGAPGRATPEVGERPSPGARSSADATATSEPSSTPSASADRETAAGVLSAVRASWQSGDELDVLVLGDESGAGDDGWVRKLAEETAKERPVLYMAWQAEDKDYGKTELGEGSGPPLNLYNVSLSDGTAASIDEAEQAYGDSKPDIVILSFGHNEERGEIADSYNVLVDALPGEPLVVALLQNPHAEEDGQRENARDIKRWGNDSETPVLDVFAAFTRNDRPLGELLDGKGILPNEDGSNLWAEYVLDQFAKAE